MMFLGGSEPHAVIRRVGGFVAENQDNFVLNINREAAEHRAAPG